MIGPAHGASVVVAPNAMRGHLDPIRVAAALARGVTSAAPAAAVHQVPLADGGDGTLDVVARAVGGVRHSLQVPDVFGRHQKSEWLSVGAWAFVESARCCGLAPLQPSELDPMRASSVGVGTSIVAAIRAGLGVVHVGLGGTAVVDGGAGALSALGVRFLDATGAQVPAVPATIGRAVEADLRPAQELLAGVRLRLLSDVSTPYADNSLRFGAQKGLTDAQVPAAAAAMAHLVQLALRAGPVGGPELLRSRCGQPWWGAGGGIGLGLSTVAEVDAQSGTLSGLALVDPDATVTGAPLVVTAEGVVDASTWTGKVPGVVSELRRGQGRPTVLVAARFEGGRSADALRGQVPLQLDDHVPLTDRLEAAGCAAWRWFAGASSSNRRVTKAATLGIGMR